MAEKKAQINNRRGTRIIVGMVPAEYDKVVYVEPNSLSERYIFYLADTLVGVITLTYTSSDKDILDEVVRTNAL